MKPTGELRRLLDERGVEYDAVNESVTIVYLDDRYITFLLHGGKFSVEVVYPKPVLNGTVYLTPQQAVDAALGNGECEMRLVYEDEDEDGCIWPDHYECSECHARVNGILPYCDTEIAPKFCPNCGRKVKRLLWTLDDKLGGPTMEAYDDAVETMREAALGEGGER